MILHTLHYGAFPWVFLWYAPLLGEIFQLQPKACCAYDHEPSCNTQPLKDPLLWRVSLTEDSSFLAFRVPPFRVLRPTHFVAFGGSGEHGSLHVPAKDGLGLGSFLYDLAK